MGVEMAREDLVACEHVVQQATRLARLRFDHGGGKELPLRRDVLEFTRGALFRLHDPLVRAGGLADPSVTKGDDGTLRVIWSQDDRHVALWVPCDGVVTLERFTIEADNYMEMTLYPDPDGDSFDLEVDRAFDWLSGEGDEFPPAVGGGA